MVLRHRLAGLIWAALLVLAIQLVPNAAFAHAGHDHSGVAPTSSSSIAHPQTSDAAQQPATELELTAVDEQGEQGSTSSSGCIGGCCGSGMSCCGAVLAFSTGGLPDDNGPADIVAPVSDRRAGIDPDALGRPPKSLA
jgi:hypothetical protein